MNTIFGREADASEVKFLKESFVKINEYLDEISKSVKIISEMEKYEKSCARLVSKVLHAKEKAAVVRECVENESSYIAIMRALNDLRNLLPSIKSEVGYMLQKGSNKEVSKCVTTYIRLSNRVFAVAGIFDWYAMNRSTAEFWRKHKAG